METNEITSTTTLGLTPNARNYLMTTTKWAKFLAIIGFIGCGIMVIASVFIFAVSSFMPNMNQMGGMGSTSFIPFKIIAILYLGLSVFYFFIAYYMYQFASKSSNAIILNIDSELEQGFKAMKNQYTLMGIATIVIISFTFLAIIIGIVAAIAATSAAF